MATLVASSSSTQGNPLVFSSSDTSNLFFGTSSADYVTYTGRNKLTVLDVSNGDDFTFDNIASTGLKAKVVGNTVSLTNANGTEIAKLGGLTSAEAIKVRFSDGNFMTLTGTSGGANYRVGGGTDTAVATTPTTVTNLSDSLKLTEVDISATHSGTTTVTVTISPNGQTFTSATVDFSMFGGAKTVATTLTNGNYVASYNYTSLNNLPVITGGVNGTAVTLVDTALTDLSDYIAVTATKGSDSVTVDNIAPVLNESLITTTTPTAGTSGTITVSVPNLDQLGNQIFGVTVDFSEFGGPAEVEAVLTGSNYVATATGVATTGESDQAIVTAVDIVGNVTTFIDAAPIA